jgi:cytochrome c peroxidase
MRHPRALYGMMLVTTLHASLSFAVGTPAQITPPLGLPPVAIPADNPLTREKIDLGRQLFMDRRLSHNNTMSCAMCHVPEQGFTSYELGTAIGMQGRSLRRNSPTIYNVGYHKSFFHEGREPHMEDQVWGPLLTKVEMDMPSIGYVVEKVRQMPEYTSLFKAAFGDSVNAERIGHALASYQRTLVSGNSRFDRWYYGGDKKALNKQEQRGFDVFMGKGRCTNSTTPVSAGNAPCTPNVPATRSSSLPAPLSRYWVRC